MWQLYLDESGDLGFDFDDKNPSRFLTIAILATSHRDTVKRIRCALKKTLSRKVNRRKKRNVSELKGSSTTIEVKRHFYDQIKDCRFGVYAMTLNKQAVNENLRQTAQTKSRLYNFVARQVLDRIPFEMAGGAIELIVDKSKGRREVADFNGYVLSQLEARLDPKVALSIYHRDSRCEPGLSAVDLFCWGIARKYERGDEEWYGHYRDKVLLDEQYL